MNSLLGGTVTILYNALSALNGFGRFGLITVKRLVLITAFLGGMVWGAGKLCLAEGPASIEAGSVDEEKLSGQLKIYRAALLQGVNEQIRIDAAKELLLNEGQGSRQILLNALSDQNNVAARRAVCQALSQSRSWNKSIRSKEDFAGPLFGILKGQVNGDAKLAAEALLVFEYNSVARSLREIIASGGEGYQARLNAIYALKLRPEKEAIIELTRLRENPDKAIATTAEKELQSLLGVPVGTDEQTWAQILKELQRKSRYEFMRDRLVLQEMKVNKLKSEVEIWQNLYLSSLDKLYEDFADDATKGAFLAEYLCSGHSKIKLWALEKVRGWRLSGGLPQEVIGPKLLELVSDGDAEVRLRTARLLAIMGSLNSAEKLLEQFKKEDRPDIRMELLSALGEACNFAFLPNSGIKLPEQVRKEALEFATEYVRQGDTVKAQTGAQVLGKLLEHDGLGKEEVSTYFGLLAERYEQEKAKAAPVLRGGLLNVMAGLCGSSAYKPEAGTVFEPVFMEGLGDEANSVREAVVSGLINIDKARALQVLTGEGRNLVNAPSPVVRKMLIDLAGSVGTSNEIIWLAKKLGSNSSAAGEADAAWQAISQILKRSDVPVVCEWIEKLEAGGSGKPISAGQSIYLLEMVEQKATGQSDANSLKAVRERLAEAYREQGKFEKAAKYFGVLLDSAESDSEREKVLASLVEVDLKSGQVAAVTQLVANQLLEKDLGPNDVIVQRIDAYLSDLGEPNERKAALDRFYGIRNGNDRPLWAEQLGRWRKEFSSCGQAEPNQAPAKQ